MAVLKESDNFKPLLDLDNVVPSNSNENSLPFNSITI